MVDMLSANLELVRPRSLEAFLDCGACYLGASRAWCGMALDPATSELASSEPRDCGAWCGAASDPATSELASSEPATSEPATEPGTLDEAYILEHVDDWNFKIPSMQEIVKFAQRIEEFYDIRIMSCFAL